MSDDGGGDIFGYRPAPELRDVVDVDAAAMLICRNVELTHGKYADTLLPMIALWFRRHEAEPDGARIGVAITVDMAERLAECLTLSVAEARRRHWEPSS